MKTDMVITDKKTDIKKEKKEPMKKRDKILVLLLIIFLISAMFANHILLL